MLKPVFLYYFIISVPSASGCPLVLGSFYLLTNPTILADLSVCDVLWTHAVPLAVPLILFSRLKFECSFPLPSIHLLSMFSLWPLDLKGGDNLCIQACLAEQLASPSLSGLQPVSLGEVRGKDFFFSTLAIPDFPKTAGSQRSISARPSWVCEVLRVQCSGSGLVWMWTAQL